VKDKARDITDIYTEYNNKILEKLKPIQHGFLNSDSKERATLLANIRTGIKSCASL